jgi:hypothetical protein
MLASIIGVLAMFVSPIGSSIISNRGEPIGKAVTRSKFTRETFQIESARWQTILTLLKEGLDAQGPWETLGKPGASDVVQVSWDELTSYPGNPELGIHAADVRPLLLFLAAPHPLRLLVNALGGRGES